MMWLDSIRAAVNQYPGGRAAVALRLCKSDEVLRKELAGTSVQHKLGLTDSQHIVEILSEQGIDCSAFRVAVDAACMVAETCPGICLHVLAATGSKEMSDVVTEIAASLTDGHVSDNDRRRIEKEIRDVIAGLTQLMASVKVRHAADKRARRE